GLKALLADTTAYETFDPTTAAERSMAFEALDQLAMEHLLGIR
ncbi:xylose isomerase, partial [Streptomyces sp. NPDC058193]